MNERFRSGVPPVLWLILALFAALPAAAQALDPFTIADVSVDASAVTAVEARAKAVAEGQRAAFQRLLRRMTPESEWSRLPQASGDTLDVVVRGFQVAGERSSATRYLAKLTVSFQRDRVRQILRDAGIPFTETASRPTLLLPVYRDATGLMLWEETNPWRRAWMDRPERDSLAPLLLATREQAVPDDLGPMVAVSGDEGQLRRLASRLGAGSVIVAEARAAGGRITVATTRYGTEGVETASGSYASLGEAAERLAAVWDENWKQRTVLRFDSRGTLGIEVPYAGIDAWVAIRRKLGETSEITRLEIASLTSREVRLVLSHIGDVETLKLALRQRDLLLLEADGRWRIVQAAGRPGAPAPR